MKKLILISFVFIGLFMGCSKDDSETVVFNDNFSSWDATYPIGWTYTGNYLFFDKDSKEGGILFKGKNPDATLTIQKKLTVEENGVYKVVVRLLEKPTYAKGLDLIVTTGGKTESYPFNSETTLSNTFVASGTTTIGLKYTPFMYSNDNPKRVKSITVYKQ